MANHTLTGALTFSALLYLCAVRAFRWKRYQAIHRKYQARYESQTLTPEEAQEIVQAAGSYDMPLLLNYALAFALFKTYAIPSISKLLKNTKELGSKERIARRYADTEILISTWVMCPISGFQLQQEDSPLAKPPVADPRAMIALSRTNWLHAHYNISNDDFLYTLCLFILEPIVWTRRYGWRSLSPLECYAYFVFWAEIGRRMGIKDIPDTLEELEAWSQAYETEYMVPAETNRDVAGYTTDELLFGTPEAFGIKNFLRRMTTCLLEDRVRIAMMQPAQPWYLHALLRSVMHSISFIQRWFCFPRNEPKLVVHPPDRPLKGSPPRMHPVWWMSKPWYKAESKGLGYLLDRLKFALGSYEEMPGPRLKSTGYRLEELGPAQWENCGHEEVMKMAAELQNCPVTGPWSLDHKK